MLKKRILILGLIVLICIACTNNINQHLIFENEKIKIEFVAKTYKERNGFLKGDLFIKNKSDAPFLYSNQHLFFIDTTAGETFIQNFMKPEDSCRANIDAPASFVVDFACKELKANEQIVFKIYFVLHNFNTKYVNDYSLIYKNECTNADIAE